MKTKAVRMYGTHDLRLEEFELPEIKDDEIARLAVRRSYKPDETSEYLWKAGLERSKEDKDVTSREYSAAGVLNKTTLEN